MTIKKICKAIEFLVELSKKAAMAMVFAMMVIITVGVMLRFLGHPILGDVELVQFCMVAVVLFAVSYTESVNGHVRIGVIVDKLSPRVQFVLDVIARILNIAFCSVAVWAFIEKFPEGLWKSDMLRIPYLPFRVFMIIGFILWGLEVFRKLVVEIEAYRSPQQAEVTE